MELEFEVPKGPERDHLEMLLRRVFKPNDQKAKVLQFIISEHFAGRGTELSEERIQLGCSGTSSPVRKIVSDIRNKLARYYAYDARHQGALKLEIKLGSFQPIFHSVSKADVTDRSVSSKRFISPPSGGHEQADDIYATFQSAKDSPVQDRIRACKSGEHVRIAVTAFAKLAGWKDAVKEALENGAEVEILLTHPSSALAQLRRLAIAGDVPSMVRSNRRVLQELQPLGKLSVRLTSEFQSIGYFQVEELICFSVLWSRSTGTDGPAFAVRPNSRTARFIQNQCKELWRAAQPDDLSGSVPEPDQHHRRYHPAALANEDDAAAHPSPRKKK